MTSKKDYILVLGVDTSFGDYCPLLMAVEMSLDSSIGERLVADTADRRFAPKETFAERPDWDVVLEALPHVTFSENGRACMDLRRCFTSEEFKAFKSDAVKKGKGWMECLEDLYS